MQSRADDGHRQRQYGHGRSRRSSRPHCPADRRSRQAPGRPGRPATVLQPSSWRTSRTVSANAIDQATSCMVRPARRPPDLRRSSARAPCARARSNWALTSSTLTRMRWLSPSSCARFSRRSATITAPSARCSSSPVVSRLSACAQRSRTPRSATPPRPARPDKKAGRDESAGGVGLSGLIPRPCQTSRDGHSGARDEFRCRSIPQVRGRQV